MRKWNSNTTETAAIQTMKSHNAFTLAEVLITLGIIGVVAAMTLPALVQSYQKMVLKNQFKKSYANFFNAVKLAQAKIGSPVGCSYWTVNPFCALKCVATNPIYGTCSAYTCMDGSPMPGSWNGPREDCAVFEEELFTKTLKVVKFCQNNSLVNGCITNEYRGTDKIRVEQNPDAEFPPNPSGNFSDSNIKNAYSSWILADGTLIIKYGNYKSRSFPIYTIDINGHKKPNKWGHDIFTLKLVGDSTNGITKMEAELFATEKGGVSTAQMLKDMNK